jgi:nucleotide-binding universal stress UspA family protein
VLTSVRGGDPGYEETSKMVAEAALLLTRWRDAPPDTPRHALRMGGRVGGVLTPAFAFGEGLRTVLHERGIEFIEHVLPEGSTVGDELRRLAAERVKG